MLKVALIGATGAVGQEFVVALDKHPWFELVQIASSERSAGKKYVDAIRDPVLQYYDGTIGNKFQIM